MHQTGHISVDAAPVDPRIDGALRHLLAIGAVLVLLLPAARGSHAVLGWWPLWLLAMPAAAWWALHRFALPGWPAALSAHPRTRRRARPGPQARRHQRQGRIIRVPRAA